MIILEAMSEMEKTDVRVDDAVNQYQWMNITQTVTFSLIQGHASFSRLLKILYESVNVYKLSFFKFHSSENFHLVNGNSLSQRES